MKIRISNKFNKQTNSFDKALYDIRESDKTISGRFSMSIKKKITALSAGEPTEKWYSAHMSFVAFKDDINHETLAALRGHDGKMIDVDGVLSVDKSVEDKGYFKFIIKTARPYEEKKTVGHWQEEKPEKFNARELVNESKKKQENFETEDEIPF